VVGSSTFTGDISGDGGFTKRGAGTLTLSGTNSWDGASNVTGGTLVVDTGSLPGDVTNNGALTFNQATTGAFSGVISGSGTFTKTGAGNLTLSGSNTYEGATTVSAGTLTLSDASALGTNANVTVASGATLVSNESATATNLSGAGDVTVASGKTLTSDNTSDSTFSGDISGSGGFTKTGTETLTLSGTNSYSGETTVTAGTLQAATSSVPGAITNNATLTIDQDTDGTLSGVIAGTGAFNKAGTGNVTMSGANSYSGATTVSAGTLTVTGGLENSAVTIDSGATVRGIGTLGSTTVDGILFPGQSIGTMTIAGDYVQNSGSTLSLEIAADGTASMLDISGTATINSGATLEITPLPGDYVNGTVYTLIDAAGGLTGTFSSNTVVNEAEIDGHEFRFNYKPKVLQMVVGNLTTVCHKTPAYLNANLTNQANHFSANLLNFRNEQRIISWGSFSDGQQNQTRGYVVGDYATGHTERRQYAIGSKYSLGGAMFGVEHPVSETLIVGGCGFYSQGSSEAYNNCGKSDSRNYSFGGYVQKYWKLFTADAFFVENIYHLHPHRQTNGVDVNQGHQNGNGSSVQGKVLVNVDSGIYHARPLAALRYMYNRLKPYKESASKEDQYRFSSQRFGTFESMLGVYMWGEFPISLGVVSPVCKIIWTREFLNELHRTAISKVDLSDPTANIKIQTKEDNVISLAGGINVAIKDSIRFESLYEANFLNKEAPSQEVRFGFSWVF
jgi:autotransporter-associated beta strand protein